MLRTRSWMAAVLAAVALLAGACGGDDDKKDATPEKPTTTTAARKPAPTFEPGTTMDTIQEKGKIVVGTKFD
ncbi:MAG TPA: hypothetical protein VM030_05920, partial [Acidimicrobiales bacterium]|nr:hypothetical protein [Acidimicrobiales bacterium]